MLRYFTAGESHGRCLIVVLEGIPAGLQLNEEDINSELHRRQHGFGRGKRMNIEKDRIEILSGIRFGETIGSPIAMMIENKDWQDWKEQMSVCETRNIKIMEKPLTHPRPGHADLAGIIKFRRSDVRDILERSSARETAARVAVGAVCKKLLSNFNMRIFSFLNNIGGIKAGKPNLTFTDIERFIAKVEKSELRCPDKKVEILMINAIKKAYNKGDSIGGIFTVIIHNVPVGLGSHTQWDLKLDGRLAQSVMSIQGIKGVEIGCGFDFADKSGSEVHDEIFYRPVKNKGKGFYRMTNNAGGIEGGISNGENIVLRAVMKPIPSLKKPLRSVDILTKKQTRSDIVRADTCAVPAAGVVAEAVTAFEITRAMKEKFGGDSMFAMMSNYSAYIEYIRNF
jgi:chorismate synthase